MLFIVQFEDIYAAEALYQEGPFWKAGLRKPVRVSVWAKAVWSSVFSE